LNGYIRYTSIKSLLSFEKFIEGIDANDNGISAYPSDIKPKFECALSITGMVAALNPAWNEQVTEADIDQRFEQASTLMGEQFLKKLDFYGKAWLPARDIVVRALEQSQNLDPKGRILHLPQYCPWKVLAPHCVHLIIGTCIRIGGRARHHWSDSIRPLPR
jgi:uncharacterized UPF0160 family protein